MPEQTLLLIKPNAVNHHHIGEIITIIEQAGFAILRIKSFWFDQELASRFYEEHDGKWFFPRLMAFMMSGMIVGLLLEKENAVHELREIIGATNPDDRKAGTIRALYAESYNENAVHGSDTHEHAIREIGLIFP